MALSTIFAIDASGKTAGVSVFQNGSIVFEETLHQGLTHSETLMALIDKAFSETNLTPEKVSKYAITAGPGSFTGLRIGMALVKGLVLPYNTLVVPVSTLEALAYAYPHTGIVVSALDARRGEVYWAAFKKNGTVLRLTPDAAGPAETIFTEIDASMHNTQSQQNKLIFVGDGAGLCYTVYDTLEGLSPEPKHHSIATGAALLASNNTSIAISGEQLTPSYLRVSQAERERLARLKLQ